MSTPHQPEQLMTAAQVAAACGVDPKTVANWAATGRLKVACKTLGGHRRFRESDVRAALQEAVVIDRTPVCKGEPADFTGADYVYKQLADHIARQIGEQMLPGDRLPGVRVLAAHHKVAAPTVRRALRELRDRGLVVIVPVRGTFVARRDAQ